MTFQNEPSPYEWLNMREYEAAKASIEEAGEYIESIGKTDLAEYTKEEMETLLLVIVNAAMRRAIPF